MGVVVDENVITVVTKSTSEAIVGNKVVVAGYQLHTAAATYLLGLIDSRDGWFAKSRSLNKVAKEKRDREERSWATLRR